MKDDLIFLLLKNIWILETISICWQMEDDLNFFIILQKPKKSPQIFN